MRTAAKVIFTLTLISCISSITTASEISVIDQSIKTSDRMMALSVRSTMDIWVVGTNASIYRSVDGGGSWNKITPPVQSEGAEFRDVEALGNGVVIVMSAGVGKDSNIFRSADNGLSWVRVMQATDDKAFFNCVTFENDQNGWLYGDAFLGQLFMLATKDGGLTWQRNQIPIPALENEGGFSSSGTCIDSQSSAPLLIGAGNASEARLIIRQTHWRAINSPLKSGEAAGIFTLQRDGHTVFVAGGSLMAEGEPAQAFQYHLQQDSWTDLGNTGLSGAIYGSALTGDWLLMSNPDGISVYNRTSQRWKKSMVTIPGQWTVTTMEIVGE